MTKFAIAIATGALLAAAAAPAFAHHSTAQYDSQNPVVAKGTVKAFAPSNPHMHLTLEVVDAKGARTVELEGVGVQNMYRLGWKRGMINVGDKITVKYSPLRTGMEGYGGLFSTITLADGRVIGRKDTAVAAR